MAKYLTIMNKFKIHPFTYIFIFIIIINGEFNKFASIMNIILFHELGHILSGLFFKWKIDKIIILPFGCLTIFDEKINKPIFEEFIISILGFIFQIIQLFFIANKKYSIILLLFNLLPIYPLDGYKILNLFLNKILPFKISHLISAYISFIAIFFYNNNLIVILIISLLLFNTIKQLYNHKYIFNKFILERKIYSFNFKKFKQVKSIKNFKRDYRHLILDNDRYITEKEYLNR